METDFFRKSITTVIWTVGMLIFAVVVLIRVEVWARCQNAEASAISAELEWGSHLYKKEIDKMMKNKITQQTVRNL